MREIKLKTFFLLIYAFIILFIATFFYSAGIQYKEEHVQLLNSRAMSILYETRNTVSQLAKINRIELIEPIFIALPQHRSFIKSIAISLNKSTLDYASDKNMVGLPFSNSTLIKHDTIVAEILAGETSFRFPMTFMANDKLQYAVLVLEIDKNKILEDGFLQNHYTQLSITTIIFILLFAFIFFIMYWYLVLPIKSFIKLIVQKKSENTHFMISDLNDLYSHLSNSYVELHKHEDELETTIHLKNYLYDILHTMDIINRLLMSDKSIENMLIECCELLGQHGDYKLTWIGYAINNKIDIVAHSNDLHGHIPQLNLSLDPNDITFTGPATQCILKNQTILLQSIEDETFSPWKERAERSGHQSLICLPLRSLFSEKPFGVLTVYSSKPFGFLTEEITMLEDLAGDIGYAIASRKKQDALHLALTTDHLTGLKNRAMLLDRLNQCNNPQLLLININRFSDINAVYGFDAGDSILHSFGKCLKQFLPKENEQLFRLHSDTFAIMCSDSFGSSSAELLIEQIVTYLSEHPFNYNEIDIWLSIAAGYSDSTVQIVENAEIALKKAKMDKTTFQIFLPSIRHNKLHENNITWYKIIKDAITEDRIVPYFQPIINNHTGKIEKYEALIRLNLSDGTVVSPFKFLDIAKKTGLYPQLTKIMAQKTIKKFQDHQYRVSLNISTEDITTASIVTFLRNLIANDNIGRKIVFEILESEGIDNYVQVSEFINEFKNLGCQFALDDFGTGYSNFEHLIKLQVDFIKIDGSLVKNLVQDKNAQVIVKNIQNFAAEMGIATIAEFVSTKEIYEIVNAMGITYSQGYYFAEPSKELLIMH